MIAKKCLIITFMVLVIVFSRLTFGWTMRFYDPSLMAEV